MSKLDLLVGESVVPKLRIRLFLRGQGADRMGWIRSVQLLGRSYPFEPPRDIAPDFGDITIEGSGHPGGLGIRSMVLVGSTRKVVASVESCDKLPDGSYFLTLRSK